MIAPRPRSGNRIRLTAHPPADTHPKQNLSVGALAVHVVTGGVGFIGSHIVEALVRRGDKFVIVDDMSTGKLGNLRGVEDSIELLALDLVR